MPTMPTTASCERGVDDGAAMVPAGAAAPRPSRAGRTAGAGPRRHPLPQVRTQGERRRQLPGSHPLARAAHRVRARPEPGRAHPARQAALGRRTPGPPINVRPYRKGGPSLLDLGQAMIGEVAGWLPDRRFLLGYDGAYARWPAASSPHPRRLPHQAQRRHLRAAPASAAWAARPSAQKGRPAALPRTARPQDVRGLAGDRHRGARAAGPAPGLGSARPLVRRPAAADPARGRRPP